MKITLIKEENRLDFMPKMYKGDVVLWLNIEAVFFKLAKEKIVGFDETYMEFYEVELDNGTKIPLMAQKGDTVEVKCAHSTVKTDLFSATIAMWSMANNLVSWGIHADKNKIEDADTKIEILNELYFNLRDFYFSENPIEGLMALAGIEKLDSSSIYSILD